MKISSKGLGALKLMVDLGEHQMLGPVSLGDISERKNISKKFLEQIAITFKQSGLISGSRGKDGGYILSSNPKNITLLSILRLTEGWLSHNEDKSDPSSIFISKAESILDEYLSSITLEDLIEKQIESYQFDYSI